MYQLYKPTEVVGSDLDFMKKIFFLLYACFTPNCNQYFSSNLVYLKLSLRAALKAKHSTFKTGLQKSKMIMLIKVN